MLHGETGLVAGGGPAEAEFEPATVAGITAYDGREVIAEVDGQELHGVLWIEGANRTAERALLQIGLDVQELDPQDVAIRQVRRR